MFIFTTTVSLIFEERLLCWPVQLSFCSGLHVACNWLLSYCLKLMLYEPVFGSLSALKLSSDMPNLPRTVLPSSFSLPAGMTNQHCQYLYSQCNSLLLYKACLVLWHILLICRPQKAMLAKRVFEHTDQKQHKPLPSISSFIFSCLSATIGWSLDIDFCAIGSSGWSSWA